MMSKYLVYAGILAGVWFLGYSMRPEPEVKIVEKIVKQKEIVEKIRIIESPDGTKTTIIDRRSKEKSKSELKKHIIPSKKDWIVGVGKHISKDVYSISVSRRVLGDIYVGGEYNTGQGVLVHLAVTF